MGQEQEYSKTQHAKLQFSSRNMCQTFQSRRQHITAKIIISPSRCRSKIVDPTRQPVPTLGKLQLNIWLRARIIRSIQLLIRLIDLQNVLTIDRIRILSPLQGARARRLDIRATDPASLLTAITPRIDHADELVGIGSDNGGAVAARVFFDHLRVPAGVQVGGCAVPGDGNLVAAKLFGFVMQRLGDVAEEMNQEFEGFFTVLEGITAVVDYLGLGEGISREI